jgi:hypothetical protein
MALGSTRSFINQNDEGHSLLGTNIDAVIPSVQQHQISAKRGIYSSQDIDLINSSASTLSRDQTRQAITIIDINTGRTVVSDTLENKAPNTQPLGHTATQQTVLGTGNLGILQENQIRDNTSGPVLSILPDNQTTPSVIPSQTFIANLGTVQEQQIQTMDVTTSQTAQNLITVTNKASATGDIDKLQLPPLLIIGLVGVIILWSVTR